MQHKKRPKDPQGGKVSIAEESPSSRTSSVRRLDASSPDGIHSGSTLASGQSFSKRQRLLLLFMGNDDDVVSFSSTCCSEQGVRESQDMKDARWRQYRRSDESTSNLSTLTEASETSRGENDADGWMGTTTTIATTTTTTKMRRTRSRSDEDLSHVVIRAPLVGGGDLTEQMESLTSDLESWSITNLREWRRTTTHPSSSTDCLSVGGVAPMDTSSSSSNSIHSLRRSNMTTRQQTARRNVMRALMGKGGICWSEAH